MSDPAIIGRVQSPRIIRIGGGVAVELPQVMGQLGLSHPLVVTDTNLAALGHLKTITDLLEGAGIPFGVFDGVVEDPTDNSVDRGIAALNGADYDCIIGFGGGSPMDTAKAISFMPSIPATSATTRRLRKSTGAVCRSSPSQLPGARGRN